MENQTESCNNIALYMKVVMVMILHGIASFPHIELWAHIFLFFLSFFLAPLK